MLSKLLLYFKSFELFDFIETILCQILNKAFFFQYEQLCDNYHRCVFIYIYYILIHHDDF